MQTFLPYPDFEASARCLDTKRLGKQRVEVLQILNALTRPDARGWKNHPATRMWRGHEGALIRYGVVVCNEWRSRGFSDTVGEKLLAMASAGSDALPVWFGDPPLHASHRSRLLRKDPDHYAQFGWTETPSDENYWPVVDGSPHNSKGLAHRKEGDAVIVPGPSEDRA